MVRDATGQLPYGSAHFLVDLGGGDPRAPEAGFCEVVFPEFRIDADQAAQRLILRRGVTGSLDLYAWWDEARREKTSRPRTIKVQLMTPDLSRPVMTWSFHGVRPVTLWYAPLNALQATVLIESLELEFDTFDMRSEKT